MTDYPTREYRFSALSNLTHLKSPRITSSSFFDRDKQFFIPTFTADLIRRLKTGVPPSSLWQVRFNP